jgi:hypothetical protein
MGVSLAAESEWLTAFAHTLDAGELSRSGAGARPLAGNTDS